MFSALKFGWLLDAVDPDRRRSRNGEIAVGTVDCLDPRGADRTPSGRGRQRQPHPTARPRVGALVGPALRRVRRADRRTCPRSSPSDAPATITAGPLTGVPVAAVLADSHAATYAHGIRTPGRIKATYGTGSSIMALSDERRSGFLLGHHLHWSFCTTGR